MHISKWYLILAPNKSRELENISLKIMYLNEKDITIKKIGMAHVKELQ